MMARVMSAVYTAAFDIVFMGGNAAAHMQVWMTVPLVCLDVISFDVGMSYYARYPTWIFSFPSL